MTKHRTRLAPSPTGALHLGNARTFLINWALARQKGWSVVLRIEDLDRPRVRPGAAESVVQLFQWLGISFDEGPIIQSHDLAPYRDAMRTLTDLKLAYSCDLTRRQIEQAGSAPHAGEGELLYPPHLRPADSLRFVFQREDANYRFVVSDDVVCVRDEIAGASEHCPSREVGDFVIWTKLGVPAYQLAVVVDDARQGVTDVVRGDDLLPSAARQILLYRALDLPEPRWWHVPLVLGEDGRRLAKRHGDTHLETVYRRGARPERVVGLLAHWCGTCPRPTEMNAQAFLAAFDLARLPRTPITMTRDDYQWLVHGS